MDLSTESRRIRAFEEQSRARLRHQWFSDACNTTNAEQDGRVKRVAQLDVTEIRSWNALERISVKRDS